MTKVFLILLMFGTHADTGGTVSKAGIFKSYSTMRECVEAKKSLMGVMRESMEKSGWIAGKGKVKVNHFNAVCESHEEINA